VLQDSLGSSARCVLFITISQHNVDCDETLCTLNFGTRARKTELGASRKNASPSVPVDDSYEEQSSASAVSLPESKHIASYGSRDTTPETPGNLHLGGVAILLKRSPQKPVAVATASQSTKAQSLAALKPASSAVGSKPSGRATMTPSRQGSSYPLSSGASKPVQKP
jgi:hypothetical protein